MIDRSMFNCHTSAVFRLKLYVTQALTLKVGAAPSERFVEISVERVVFDSELSDVTLAGSNDVVPASQL